MATIAGVDCTDGILLAGDRAVVRDGTVVGSRRRVFDFDGVGTAAVGDDPDAFRRQLDAAIRKYRTERGEPGIDAAIRMAADLVDAAGVEALVAARDESSEARIKSVDGGVLDERVATRGSAAEIVIGRLSGLDEPTLDEAESAVREAFQAAASRDAGTGEELDVWRLEDG